MNQNDNLPWSTPSWLNNELDIQQIENNTLEYIEKLLPSSNSRTTKPNLRDPEDAAEALSRILDGVIEEEIKK